MNFSSFPFLVGFLPLFFLLYDLFPPKKRNLILLLGSLAFYFAGTYQAPECFLLFLLTILMDFFLANGMTRFPRFKKCFLILGILLHMIPLIFFKYANFVIGEWNRLFNAEIHYRVLLPIGISFYTFQGISYLVDVFRGTVPAERSLLCYGVYLSMFEQLIAGPIVTYSEIRNSLRKRTVNLARTRHGLGTFIFGLSLKILVANPLGKLFSQVQAIGFDSISVPLAWLSIAAFSFQLYFDFYGYSVMAQGLGTMLGFCIPKNFYYPYLARSMTEFWRRWHITLGRWFREYIYIPLGGSRNGTAATIRNIFLVWIFTALWHGAGYNFLLWGLTLTIVLLGEKFLYGVWLDRHPLLGHLYMLLLIPLTWAIFAIEDLPQMAVFFRRLFGLGAPAVIMKGDFLKYFKLYCPFFGAAVLFSTPVPYRLLKTIHRKWIRTLFVAILFLACLYCLYRGFDDPFLYFRF